MRLSATVRYDEAPGDVPGDAPGDTPGEEFWFEVPARDADALHASGDAFIAALAPLASLRRESLHVGSPSDDVLVNSVQEVTRVWRAWYSGMQSVQIEAPPTSEPPPDGRRVAAFFSGGVDSFFTALRHAAGHGTPVTLAIDDLILVHGFDIPLANERAFAHVEDSLTRAAEALGKRLVTVATNIRETRFAETDWPALSHGPALAAVAHALSQSYHTVLIGSSAGYGDLRFWGSHPLTDPMFTSSRTRVQHDGPAFMRVEKTEYVARDPVAMRHLRVCYLSDDGSNCGRCNNCYRTMLALDALGVLDGCATFDRDTLDLAQAARIFCRYDFDVRQFGYVADLARRHQRHDIERAVERSLRDSRRLRLMLHAVRRLRDRPGFERRAREWERWLLRGWL